MVHSVACSCCSGSTRSAEFWVYAFSSQNKDWLCCFKNEWSIKNEHMEQQTCVHVPFTFKNVSCQDQKRCFFTIYLRTVVCRGHCWIIVTFIIHYRLNTFLIHFLLISLTHIHPMFHFCTPWKHQKTCGFLFSGGIEVEHKLNMG